MKSLKFYGIMKIALKALLFGALFLMLAGIRFDTARAEEPGVYTLPVFETSDVHGYLADTTSEYEYRLAFISDKVKDARTQDGVYRKERAVLLDGGDIFQGNTISNFLKGHSLSAAYQLMDYDAVTIGNHEFDWGIETVIDPDGTLLDYNLDGTYEVNDVPVLASNIYKDRKPVDFAEPYIILEKEAVDGEGNVLNVRIAAIGYTEDYSSSIMETRFTGAGFLTLPGLQSASELAARLEEAGECDATVLLAHAAAADTAYAIAAGSAIDLVLGGHTHRDTVGTTVYGLPFMQPAANASSYAVTSLRFRKGENGEVEFAGAASPRTVSVSGEPWKLRPTEANAEELDPVITELTTRVIREIDDLLEAKIGVLTEPAMKNEILPDSGGRSSSAGHWMASIIKRSVGADVGFVNGGGIRTSFPLQGDRRIISASDVYTMFPFNNMIYCYELTYEEFLKLLRYSLTSSGSSLLSDMVGVECHFSGTEVQAIVKDGKAVYYNGEWKNGWAEKTIRVAVSEFVATTNRTGDGWSNPLTAWARTGRLISSDTFDVEGAFRVLDEESAANHWQLSIDRSISYTDTPYRDPNWTKEDGGASDPETVSPSEGDPDSEGRELSPEKETEKTGVPLWVIIVIAGGALLVSAAAVVLFFVLKKRRKKSVDNDTSL